MGGISFTQWINGSFVTKMTNPDDIDFITFIEHEHIKKFGTLLSKFRKGESWSVFGVDAYIIEVYPVTDKLRKFTEIDRVEWLSQFTKTEPNRNGKRFPKGCLEIIY